MPKKISAGPWSITILTLGFVISALPAYAGFEWVAPNDGAVYQPSASGSYAAAPAATSMPEVISPVIITGDSMPVRVAPSYLDMSSAPAPVAAAPAPTVASVPVSARGGDKVDLATATINVPAAGGDKVQGFASQIPLALALRQILPTGYNFSIDQDVDMNTLVSYKGGDSWRDTLKAMLTPVGLAAHEQGTAITVGHAGESAAPVVAAMPYLPPIAPAKNVSQPSYLALPAARTDMAMFNANAAGGWSAERGDTLRKVLVDWCRRANVELQWLAEYDYPVEASTHFSGGFEDAVRGLLDGFDGARPQPIGELHTNPSAGQMVLVVQARGNSYSN